MYLDSMRMINSFCCLSENGFKTGYLFGNSMKKANFLDKESIESLQKHKKLLDINVICSLLHISHTGPLNLNFHPKIRLFDTKII